MGDNRSGFMPFSRHLGAEIITATPQQVAGRLVVRPELCTINHEVHGGAIMAFADTLGTIVAFLRAFSGSPGRITRRPGKRGKTIF